jgi:hypothetical protein
MIYIKIIKPKMCSDSRIVKGFRIKVAFKFVFMCQKVAMALSDISGFRAKSAVFG